MSTPEHSHTKSKGVKASIRKKLRKSRKVKRRISNSGSEKWHNDSKSARGGTLEPLHENPVEPPDCHVLEQFLFEHRNLELKTHRKGFKPIPHSFTGSAALDKITSHYGTISRGEACSLMQQLFERKVIDAVGSQKRFHDNDDVWKKNKSRSPTITDSTPAVGQESALEKDLLYWIQQLLPDHLERCLKSKSTIELLGDGRLLCDLINTLIPNARIETSDVAADNVSKYILFCKDRLHMFDYEVFAVDDLIEQNNLSAVQSHIKLLHNVSNASRDEDLELYFKNRLSQSSSGSGEYFSTSSHMRQRSKTERVSPRSKEFFSSTKTRRSASVKKKQRLSMSVSPTNSIDIPKKYKKARPESTIINSSAMRSSWTSASPTGVDPLLEKECISGSTEKLKLTIKCKKRSDLNQRQSDIEGLTPLLLAAKHQNFEACLMLLAAGASPNKNVLTNSMTIMHYLASADKLHMSKYISYLRLFRKLLVVHKMDINALTTTVIEAPIHLLALQSYGFLLDLFLMNGVDINAITSQAATPLFYAISNQNVVAVKKLLESGADPYKEFTFEDRVAKTCYELAKAKNVRKIVELIEDLKPLQSNGNAKRRVSEEADITVLAGEGGWIPGQVEHGVERGIQEPEQKSRLEEEASLYVANKEILLYERENLNNLGVLVKGYLMPLKKSKYFSSEALDTIFGKVIDMYRKTYGHLARLEDHVLRYNFVKTVADVYKRNARYLQCYGQFLDPANAEIAYELIEKTRHKKKELDQFLDSVSDFERDTAIILRTELEEVDYSLEALLKKIYKHGETLIDLHEELLRKIPHEDVEESELVKETIEEIKNFIKKGKKAYNSSQAHSKAMELTRKVDLSFLNLDDFKEEWIMDGTLQGLSSQHGTVQQANYTCHLLSTMLVITIDNDHHDTSKKRSHLMKKHETEGENSYALNVHATFHLKDVVLHDIPDAPEMGVVNTIQMWVNPMEDSLLFTANTVSEKNRWLSAIKKQKEALEEAQKASTFMMPEFFFKPSVSGYLELTTSDSHTKRLLYFQLKNNALFGFLKATHAHQFGSPILYLQVDSLMMGIQHLEKHEFQLVSLSQSRESSGKSGKYIFKAVNHREFGEWTTELDVIMNQLDSTKVSALENIAHNVEIL